MRVFWMGLLIVGSLSLAAQDAMRLKLNPLDFGEGNDLFSLKTISQVESDGGKIYLRGTLDHNVVVLNPEGHLVQVFGQPGGHPSEIGGPGIRAMSVQGDDVWILDMNNDRVRRFNQGTYLSSFAYPLEHVPYTVGSTYSFQMSDRHLVLPYPKEGQVAAAFDREGQLTGFVGKPHQQLAAYREIIGTIDDSFWLALEDGWLSINKFVPIITRYDRKFTQQSQFKVTSAAIKPALERLQSYSPSETRHLLPATVSDAKLHDGKLFMMVTGTLHEVDFRKEQLLSTAVFFGEGPDFAAVTAPNVTVFFFAFLEGNQLVLAHPAMPWNHPLWTVDWPAPAIR